MKKLFKPNGLIEEASRIVPVRKAFAVFAMFFAVYFIGSMINGVLLIVPEMAYIYNNESVINAMSDPTLTYDALTEVVYTALTNMPQWLLACSLISTAGTIAVCIFFSKKFELRPLFTLGFIRRGAVREYLSGLTIGVLMIGASLGIGIATGQLTYNGMSSINVGMLLLFFIGFVIQGMSEEVLLRGYFTVSCATCRGGSVFFAVMSGSVIFSLLHAMNASVSALALINIFLFGVFAAIYFIRRGSIWGIAAIHTAWNFVQGNVFGIAVSGNAGYSTVFRFTAEGNTLFSGGAFGLEGGLGVTIVLLVAIAIVLPMKNREFVYPYSKKEFFSDPDGLI